MRRTRTGRAAARPRDPGKWELRVYVAGETQRCRAALSNLHHICEKHLSGRYRIQVIDLLENPQLARRDQIVAIPTIVRSLPTPLKRVIGDLSSEERVLSGLDLRAAVGMAS